MDPRSVQVHLVESPDIGLLGVGEATFPSIRGTLSAIGLDERRFLVGATATYKQGIHYRHWVRPPGTPGADHFFHPFNVPSQRPGGPELLPYWLLGAAPRACRSPTPCRCRVPWSITRAHPSVQGMRITRDR